MTVFQGQRVSKFVSRYWSSLALKRMREIENFDRIATPPPKREEVMFGGGTWGCLMEEIAFDLGRTLAEADWRRGILSRRKSMSKSTESGSARRMCRESWTVALNFSGVCILASNKRRGKICRINQCHGGPSRLRGRFWHLFDKGALQDFWARSWSKLKLIKSNSAMAWRRGTHC